MAELIAGAFLSSFFQVTLERFASRDFKDLFNKRLVEKLEITLNSINQLLDDAETKQYQNQNVKNWLDHLKHEVYEVDQLLDEIATNAHQKIKVQRFLSTLTNRFESRIKDLLDKLNFLAEQKDRLGLTQRGCTSLEGAVSLPSSKRSPTASLVDESCIYGREGDKEEIINYLLSYKDNGNRVSTISIVGLGGMGKTTLAQLVYNDQRMEKQFEHKAWVHVSKSFDVVGLTKTILRSFHSSADDEDLDPLICQLQKTLTGKKFLLVLDDVWSGNEECLEQLRIPFNHGMSVWMAEGLLKCCRRDKSEEELGNEFLDDLESISFFQQSLHNNKKIVMHDLVNDLAKSESQEFCLQIEGDSVQDISERTRHIHCYLDLKDGASILKHICKAKGLRSLLVKSWGYGKERFMISNNLQRDLFSKLEYLRMLSFFNCELKELAGEIGNLKLLRYLKLAKTSIKKLPDSICKLYKLETLILKDCSNLTELPSDFYKLVSLRHLDLKGCNIKRMPKQIGKLNNLQTLSHFVVGEENGSNIQELGNLNRLQGKLCISGLEHVINPEDAAGANLKDMKHVEELNMNYGDNYKSNNNGREVNVFEALQPNSNLKRLTISQYKGNSFPNWIRGSHLPNLVFLQLKGCGLCFDLPPLGQLPCLKELSIRDCDGIKIIGEEFHGNSSTNVPFKSLEVLKFGQMNNWEEWLCLKGFPLLKKLSIKRCPKLKRALLPEHLPSLQKLKINDCKELEVSIPKYDSLIELDLQGCDRILVNELPTSLKRFVLRENRYTEFSVEQILVNNTILEELELDLSGSLKCPSLDLCCYNSLWTLSINGLRSSSLSFSLHLFTNLRGLYLFDCPELESFPEGGLPSNLKFLFIFNCPKLIGSREEWGLFQLNSLIHFFVSDEFENVESFPEENLLPPTLGVLQLKNCSKLRKMNNKGFLHLKSLMSLFIINCPSLERLPEKEDLPNSLSTLWIEDCPLIKEKYQKEGGERWHTICHIQSVTIDNMWVPRLDQISVTVGN